MSKNHSTAISILADPNVDFKALVFEIARFNPKAVVSARIRMTGATDWKSEAREYLIAGNKVAAIRVCRVATGVSLKDAVDAVNAL